MGCQAAKASCPRENQNIKTNSDLAGATSDGNGAGGRHIGVEAELLHLGFVSSRGEVATGIYADHLTEEDLDGRMIVRPLPEPHLCDCSLRERRTSSNKSMSRTSSISSKSSRSSSTHGRMTSLVSNASTTCSSSSSSSEEKCPDANCIPDKLALSLMNRVGYRAGTVVSAGTKCVGFKAGDRVWFQGYEVENSQVVDVSVSRVKRRAERSNGEARQDWMDLQRAKAAAMTATHDLASMISEVQEHHSSMNTLD